MRRLHLELPIRNSGKRIVLSVRTRNQHTALAGPTQPGRLRDIYLRDLLPVPFSSISLTRECERKAKINISAGFVKISVYMGTKYREGKSD